MKRIFGAILACSALFLCGCGGSAPAADMMAPVEALEAKSSGTLDVADTEAVTEAAMAVGAGETCAETTSAQMVTQASAAVNDKGMEYFIFRQINNTYTDDSGRELLNESLTDPDFFSDDPLRMEWVNDTINGLYESDAAFGENLLGFARNDISGAGETGFYAYSHRATMGIARHDSHVASVLALSSSYSGGSHPTTLQTAHNLDLDTLRVLRLEDVVDEAAADGLAALVLAEVERRFSSLGEDALFDDYQQTIANALDYGNMTSYWYFTEEGIVVFFNQYELGPYASGIIKAEVAYDQLEGILLPEYFPPEHTGTVTGAQKSQSPEGDGRYYHVELSDGETVYVTVDGMAEHVQFSEVFWAGTTVVGEWMLFSADQVGDGKQIAVTGDFSDPEKIYALEYYDAAGGPYVLYVHQSEVYQELPQIG